MERSPTGLEKPRSQVTALPPRRGTQYRVNNSGDLPEALMREPLRIPKPLPAFPQGNAKQRPVNQSLMQPDEARTHSPFAQRRAPIQLSQETRQRVRAAKQYMYEYYLGWIKYINQRKQRTEAIEREIRLMPGDTGLQRKLDYFEKESKYLRQRRRKMRLGEFQLLALLGKGAFGSVYLARKRDTGEVVAVKKITKAQFDASNKDRVLREKKVLETAAENPWLIGLSYAFQDSSHLYLAMEYVPGGDVRGLLTNIGCLEESMATFYLVEMIQAVSTLHQLGYTHRDLKPDNFLIAATGHIKLGDFGLSKQGLELQYKDTLSSFKGGLSYNKLKKDLDFRTRLESYKREMTTQQGQSQVGSPDYMAVEILRGDQYNFSVDWWSIGVIWYEMLAGLPPFYSTSPMDTYNNIVNYQNTLVFPELTTGEDDGGGGGEEEEEAAVAGMSDEAWALVNAFLTEPNKRLGRDGIRGIKRHPYFAHVNWDTLLEQPPPFTPELESETDTSYFGGGEAIGPLDGDGGGTVDEEAAATTDDNDDAGDSGEDEIIVGGDSSPRPTATRPVASPRGKAMPDYVGFTFKGGGPK